MYETRLEEEYRLRALDVDINGQWMPSAIFVRMQETAEAHAEAVGYGRVQIVERGLCWALTRMRLEMDEYPHLSQRVRVITWPLKPTSLVFRRQFRFEDMDGRLLGHASSQWVLLDLNERAIRRTSSLSDFPYDPQAGRELEEPKKILLPSNMEEAARRAVLYSDVDMNAHMNNSKYLNWICELFDVPFLRENHLRSVSINYISEAYIGEEVCLYMAEDIGGYFICGKTNDRTIFDAQITWSRN